MAHQRTPSSCLEQSANSCRSSRHTCQHTFVERQTLLLRVIFFSMLLTSVALPTTIATTTVTRNIALHVLQQATKDGTTRSLSFLSSGYQSESVFLADVATCVSTLTNSTGGVSSDPWPRYITLFNIYALYEPSPQLGAGRPTRGHHYSCTYMTDCAARPVSNNLGCTFGSPNPQVLSCDVNLVRSMATYAPAQDVTVVLVNDAEPSGAGSNGVLYITNEPSFMPFMLVHYLNRAIAGLQEEYNLGIQVNHGRQTFTSPNCAASSSVTAQAWIYWKNYSNDGLLTASASAASTTGGTSSSSNTMEADINREGVGCSIASYNTPTRGGCLMQNSSIHHMCPVCREQLSLSLFNAGVSASVLLSPSTARLDLTAGRCPPINSTYYVAPPSSTTAAVTRNLYLSLGPFAFQNDVSILWTAVDGTVLATNTQTLVVEDVAAAWMLPTVVTATVTDATPNVRPAWRAARRADMTSTTTFDIAVWTSDVDCATASAATSTCFASRTVFASMPASLPTDVCVVRTATTTSTDANSVVAAAAAVVDLPALDTGVANPGRHTIPIIISSTVCGGVTVILVAVIALVFWCCVRRRPREVLNPTRSDKVVYRVTVVLAPLGVALAGLTIAFVCSFVPVHYYTGSPVVLTILVMACVMYVSAVLNFCGVLLRWFVVVLVCGVLSLLLGAGFLVTGLLALVFYLDRGSQNFSDRMSLLWLHLLSSSDGSAYVCDVVQASLKCSGFHAGCFMTVSAECPLDCANNLYYVDSCEVPFMFYVGGLYLPLAIVALVCGVWYVLLGSLNVTYYVCFCQLSRNGRLRRTFRTARKPPMMPITYQEMRELRRMFGYVCERKTLLLTLQGDAAVHFLETVFAEPLSQPYAQLVRASGPLTFDALISLHFPYCIQAAQSSTALPNLQTLTGAATGSAEQTVPHPMKPNMDCYTDVAGALSPEELHELLHENFKAQREAKSATAATTSTVLPTKKTLVEAIRQAAQRAEAAPFCRGLSTAELAGLRRAWTALHPQITGTLTDSELGVFYSWSHAGAPPLNAEGLAKWKMCLDITKSHEGIGWREFCYPYAQKMLNKAAEDFLKANGCDVPPGVFVSRARVADRYGGVECKAIFLPREKEVPMPRVVAHFLTQVPSASVAATQSHWKSLSQRADGIVKTLV